MSKKFLVLKQEIQNDKNLIHSLEKEQNEIVN